MRSGGQGICEAEDLFLEMRFALLGLGQLLLETRAGLTKKKFRSTEFLQFKAQGGGRLILSIQALLESGQRRAALGLPPAPA